MQNNYLKPKFIIPTILVLVAGYFFYKKFVLNKEEKGAGGEMTPSTGIDPLEGTITSQTNISDIKTYIVSNPSGMKVKYLPKPTTSTLFTLSTGKQVKVKPSSVSGWVQVVEVLGSSSPYKVTTKGYAMFSDLRKI